ncbi:MAG: ATP synthase F0 subunit B, partial [Desulfobulbaceae bacterium]|nr:ATP synthase F0 subunit B [Desulfobulbaceae bacterium]
DLLWRVMNFTVLVVILVLALKKPIVNGLKGRRQGIQQQFDELEARKSEAEQTYKEYEGRLAKLDDEVSRIIEAAVAQGESEKVRIIEDANRAAEDIKRQAENAVQHEITEAKKNLKDDVAEQAAKMAEELIKKNLNDADQVTLINDYLEKVGGMQ